MREGATATPTPPRRFYNAPSKNVVVPPYLSPATRRKSAARTIADLAGSDMITANHVAEAVQYRPRVGM